MDKQKTIRSKDDILGLVDKINNPKTQKILLKMFTSVFIGASDKTKEYFNQLKEFKTDPYVQALLISLAYIFQMNKVYKADQKKKGEINDEKKK